MIILKIRKHRFAQDDENVSILSYREGCSLADYLPMKAWVQPEAFEYVVSGFPVPPEHIHRFQPKDGDEIIVYPRVEGALAIVGSIVGGAIAHHIGASVALWATNGFFIGSIGDSIFGTSFFRPRLPSFSFGDDPFSASPTYAWDGIQNNTSQDMPVPIIYGQHRTGGTIISAFVEGEHQLDWSWQSITLLNETHSGFVNEFRTADIVKEIRLQLTPYPLEATGAPAHYTYRWIAKYNRVQSRVKKVYHNGHFYKLELLSESALRGNYHFYLAGYKVEYKPIDAADYNVYDPIYIPYDEQYLRWGNNLKCEIKNLEPAQYDVRITLLDGDKITNAPQDTQYYSNVEGLTQVPSKTKPDLSYLNVLIAVSEGEIDSITNIEINDTPIEYFAEGEVQPRVDVRLGTNDQDPIAGFDKIHNRDESYNLLLEKDNPQTITTTNQIEALELEFTFPEGLAYIEDDGDITSWTVQVKIEIRKVGDDLWQTAGILEMSGNVRNQFKRYFRIEELELAQYELRLTRLTDDPDWRHYGEVRLTAVDEITYGNLAYPNTALLGLRLLATDRLSGGMPKITCLVRGRKVLQPRIVLDATGEELDYDDIATDSGGNYIRIHDNAAAHWDGTWVTKYSANPIWCLYDLLTNERYGLGNYIDASELDLDQLHEMAKYCDQRIQLPDGSYEKRFRLDVVIDSEERALDLITKLAATFRGFPLWSNGKLELRIDKPDGPVQVFSRGNIIEGSFSEAFTSLRNKPNIVEVQFFNRERNYEREIIQVMDEEAIDNGEPPRKKIYSMIGITRPTQALRIAKYLLNLEKYCIRAVTFRAATDAIACQAGDVIGVQHELPQWGWGGRVLWGSITQIVIDQWVTIEEGKSYFVLVRYADDTTAERVVVNSPGKTNMLLIDANDPLPSAPQRGDIWVLGEQYPVMKEFRIISLERTNDLEVTITALEHYDAIYTDDVDAMPDLPDYSYLAPPRSIERYPPPVTDLHVEEVLYRQADGTIRTKLILTFNPPIFERDYQGMETYDHARIYISDDGGTSWHYMGETWGRRFEIADISEGRTYKIAVVSVGKQGHIPMPIDAAPQIEHTVVGKTASPSDVTNFTAIQYFDGILLNWDEVSDVDISHYEIREGRDWDNSVVIGRPPAPPFYIPRASYGTHRFWIKAVDTTGHMSDNAATDVVTVSIAPATYPIDYTDDFATHRNNGAIICAHREDYQRGCFRRCVTLGTTSPKWDDDVSWADGTIWTDVDTTSSYTYRTPILDAGQDISLTLAFEHDEDAEDGATVNYRIASRTSLGGWSTMDASTVDMCAFRYLYMEAELQAGNRYKPPVVWQMRIQAGVSERRVAISNIDISASGTTITYANYGITFMQVKSVVVSTVGSSALIPVVEEQNNQQCKIRLYNSDGIAVSGTVNVLVIGY